MALNIRLLTDPDFEEAMQRHAPLRVFKNDHMIGNGGIIVRYDAETVVVQSGVGDLAYHSRRDCEFFELRKR
ncbi:hypothetical protein D7Z26_19705 [Cohnella endophytica]|uniref:Uncharacterized protein n=1 Tax=Cohnella endophytica TaxID=2419778 RepID=A0A494XJY2_9BACL|nr:hypothetical protein [Cohnella endophytica]RKP50042.1 hypothetical protein D7Z26_19705 [Cohnella endophytica]